MTSKWPLIFLPVTTVLTLIGFVLGLLMLFPAIFIFDAPGSDKNAVLIAIFYIIVTFPVVCLGSIALSWLAYGFKWRKSACLFAVLPLTSVAAFCTLWFVGDGTGSGYEQVDGEWSYVVHTHRGADVTKLGADNASFEVLPDGKGDYAKDKNRVFLQKFVIVGVDPATFVLLKGFYSKDKSRMYCGTVPMQVSGPGAFEVVNEGTGLEIIYDHEHFVWVYGKPFESIPVSQETPAVVGSYSWGRDGTSYYFGPARVEGADYATFRVIGFSSAEDRNRKYRGPFPEKK
jgi:DKNYY family